MFYVSYISIKLGSEKKKKEYFNCESKSRSVMSDFATPWIIQSMEFSRPEYWSGLVAFPFSRQSFQPRDQTQVSHNQLSQQESPTLTVEAYIMNFE